MDENKMRVAEKLRMRREACALSQQQVADALNIDRTTYTKYETGVSEPGLTTVVKLAAVFNISPLELLPLDRPEPKPVRRLRDYVQSDSPIYQLSKDERGIVAMYRAFDKEKKKKAQELMANLAKNELDFLPK